MKRHFSLYSLVTSALSIGINIDINVKIAFDYLQADGKTKALFGLTELLMYSYKYYYTPLLIIALVLAVVGCSKKDPKWLNLKAFLLFAAAVICQFTRIWRVLV